MPYGCSDDWGYAWPEDGRFGMCSHGGHTLECQMKGGEDMLAEGGWDDCVCFVKYYAIHCVQVVTKLMVITECWW